jgi:antagonist of KipI
MKIRLIKAGLLSTIQDMGRLHYRSQAVPVSGAIDNLSAQIANMAVGNDPGCAVIEFTQSGAAFFTESDVVVAFSGGGAYLSANGGRLPSDRPIFIPAGMSLSLENNKSGSRSYLAIAGGWDVPEILGSRSTYITAKIGGLNGRCLEENDPLTNTGASSPVNAAMLAALRGDNINYPGWSIARSLLLSAESKTIRFIPGKEFNWFDGASKTAFLSQTYAVGHNSNRMGYHLKGEALKRTLEGELLSTAVTPGTIQVANDGNLILLMADCQTTGGYPRIAQVAAVDMPLCAQLAPGDVIRFKEISWKEAEMLYIQARLNLHKISLAVAQKYS